VQRARHYPAIAPVVARPCGDKHAGPEQMRIAACDDDRGRSPGVLHEGGQVYTGSDGETVPVVGLVGGENGDHEGGEK
jgi:hypothetical protein